MADPNLLPDAHVQRCDECAHFRRVNDTLGECVAPRPSSDWRIGRLWAMEYSGRECQAWQPERAI